jgi:hypothetical protein
MTSQSPTGSTSDSGVNEMLLNAKNKADYIRDMFQRVPRVTPDGLFSVVDCFVIVFGISRKKANLKLQNKEVTCLTGHLEKVKFSGAGQRPTPVASYNEIMKILAACSGPVGKAIRDEQARTHTAHQAGDIGLAESTVANHIAHQEMDGGATSALMMNGVASHGMISDSGSNSNVIALSSDEVLSVADSCGLTLPSSLVMGIYRSCDSNQIKFMNTVMQMASNYSNTKTNLESNRQKLERGAIITEQEKVKLENMKDIKTEEIAALKRERARLTDYEIEQRETKRVMKSRGRKCMTPSDINTKARSLFKTTFKVKCEHGSNCYRFVTVYLFYVVADNYSAVDFDATTGIKIVCKVHYDESNSEYKEKRQLHAESAVLWIRYNDKHVTANCHICDNGDLPIHVCDVFDNCHIQPRARGGANTSGNMVIGHPTCNRRQGTQTLEQFRYNTNRNSVDRVFRLTEQDARAGRKALQTASKRTLNTDPEVRFDNAIRRVRASILRQPKISFSL